MTFEYICIYAYRITEGFRLVFRVRSKSGNSTNTRRDNSVPCEDTVAIAQEITFL